MIVAKAVACMVAFLFLFWAYVMGRIATDNIAPDVRGYYLGMPCSMVAGLLFWFAFSA